MAALLIKECAQTEHFPYAKPTSGSSQVECNAWGRKPFSPLLAKAQQADSISGRSPLPKATDATLVAKGCSAFPDSAPTLATEVCREVTSTVRSWQMPTATKTQFEAILKSPFSITEVSNRNAFPLCRKGHTKLKKRQSFNPIFPDTVTLNYPVRWSCLNGNLYE